MMNYKIAISFLLFFSCYRLDLDEINIPEIEDIPDSSGYLEDDYSIRDFWVTGKDSSLLNLLSEFNLNNSQISILNTQTEMSKVQHKISRSDRFPSLSINNSRSKRQQNLSAYGLPDNFLDAIEENEGSDDGIGLISSFNSPKAIVIDDLQNIYVSDGNHTIRKLTGVSSSSSSNNDNHTYQEIFRGSTQHTVT